MNQYAMLIQKKAQIIGTFITLAAGFDYFLDIRHIKEVYDNKHETSSSVWAISRKLHTIESKNLKDKMVLMMYQELLISNPVSQDYILTRVELIEQEELVSKNENSMFQMLLPQGTFYGRINNQAMQNNDLINIQSLSQIVGVPLLLI